MTLNLDPEDVERRIGPRTKAIVPRAPLRPARAARRARRVRPAPARGRRPGVRRRGRRDHGRRLHLQLLPDQEPVRARRRRARRRDRRRGRGPHPDAPLPRLPRQEDVRADRDELPAGCASGRLPSDLAAASRRLERLPARGRRALRGPRSRRCRRAAAWTLRATSTTCMSSARPTGSHRSRARRAGDRLRRVLRDAAPPPAGAAPSRLAAGLPARDRAGRRREPGAAALGRDRRRRAGAHRRDRPRCGRRRVRARRETPINRHRLPQLAADFAIVVAAWFFAFRLRFDTDLPVYYEYYLSWPILRSSP